jgi:hypothetical protein
VDHQTGNVPVSVDRGLDRPLTGITFHNDLLYVTNGGKVSTVDMNGLLKNIIVALPDIGDHYMDQNTFGPDGRMYFDLELRLTVILLEKTIHGQNKCHNSMIFQEKISD